MYLINTQTPVHISVHIVRYGYTDRKPKRKRKGRRFQMGS